MVWCGSTEIFLKPEAVHETLASFEKAMRDNDPAIAPSMIYAYAALSKEQLPQPLLKHRMQDALDIANRRPKVLTSVMAALVDEGGWGAFAMQRGYLAGELEWATRLGVFKDRTEPAKLLADEANRLHVVVGKKIKGEQIVEWREQICRGPENYAKITYKRIFNALTNETGQPGTKAKAVFILKNMVRGCLNIDQRRKSLTSV